MAQAMADPDVRSECPSDAHASPSIWQQVRSRFVATAMDDLRPQAGTRLVPLGRVRRRPNYLAEYYRLRTLWIAGLDMATVDEAGSPSSCAGSARWAAAAEAAVGLRHDADLVTQDADAQRSRSRRPQAVGDREQLGTLMDDDRERHRE